MTERKELFRADWNGQDVVCYYHDGTAEIKFRNTGRVNDFLWKVEGGELLISTDATHWVPPRQEDGQGPYEEYVAHLVNQLITE